jgi:hypothetical protein
MTSRNIGLSIKKVLGAKRSSRLIRLFTKRSDLNPRQNLNPCPSPSLRPSLRPDKLAFSPSLLFGFCGTRFCGNVESEFETGCILWKQASERYSTSVKRSNIVPSIARCGYSSDFIYAWRDRARSAQCYRTITRPRWAPARRPSRGRRRR